MNICKLLQIQSTICIYLFLHDYQNNFALNQLYLTLMDYANEHLLKCKQLLRLKNYNLYLLQSIKIHALLNEVVYKPCSEINICAIHITLERTPLVKTITLNCVVFFSKYK